MYQPQGVRSPSNPKLEIAAEKSHASNATNLPVASYHSCPFVPPIHNPKIHAQGQTAFYFQTASKKKFSQIELQMHSRTIDLL